MIALRTIDSNIMSLIILLIIFFSARNRTEKAFLHHELFLVLVRLNGILVIIDMLSWLFNGRPGQISLVLNTGFNLLLYLVEPLVPMIWIFYTKLQVFHDENCFGKLKLPFAILFSINALLSIMSLYFGWFFYVTPNNVYHSGSFYFVHLILCFSLLVYSFVLIIQNRKRIEKHHFNTLLFFTLPPILGSAIQALFYGISLSSSSMSISLLIVYSYIQNKNLNTDYLTGVYNRRQLDNYVRMKIRKSTRDKSFSVILIDLNDFKLINDSFGHDVGDEALRNAVKVIKSCLRWDDFIARYGGDEFYIILNVSDRERLESRVAQINRAIERFNSSNSQPYKLNLCMGYDIYPYMKKLKSDDFLKQIDMLMYKNKEIMKSVTEAESGS